MKTCSWLKTAGLKVAGGETDRAMSQPFCLVLLGRLVITPPYGDVIQI